MWFWEHGPLGDSDFGCQRLWERGSYGLQDFGGIGIWGIGLWEHWSVGVLGHWANGTLGAWVFWSMGLWNNEVWEYGILQAWDFKRILGAWEHGTLWSDKHPPNQIVSQKQLYSYLGGYKFIIFQKKMGVLHNFRYHRWRAKWRVNCAQTRE